MAAGVLATVALAAAWTSAGDGAPGSLREAVQQADELCRAHRFADALDLLLPFSADGLDAADRHALCAERGRARFHLGRYRSAHSDLMCAVRSDPTRPESALYLMATSYLLGNRQQALRILEELLRSGPTDLYPIVTLPGERSFLSDPEVWRVLERHSTVLDVAPASGEALGVRPGQSRRDAVAALRAAGWTVSDGDVVAVRAGPHLVWMLRFADDRLVEILLQVESLVRYTPFRVRLGPHLGWTSGPDEAARMLGHPAERRRDPEGGLILVWRFAGFDLTLAFGPASEPVPPALPTDRGVLQVVDITEVSR